MADETMKVTWMPWAEQLLHKRDRYTRGAIVEEFCSDPRRGALALDPASGWFATPVANNRFTVVWHHVKDGDAPVAQVGAVFPTQFVGETSEQLREQVMAVVAQESGGKVKLF
jgi:hypothetical protein